MLSKISVKKPFTVIVGIIIVIILGVVSYVNTGVDLLPSMNLPYIVVVTINPGAAPEEVEKTLTTPLENGLSTVAKIKSMSSTSSEHFSMIILEFDYDAEVDRCYSDVKAALDLVSLPNDDLLQDPIVLKINPSMLPIMRVSIAKDGETIKESNTYLSNVIEQIGGIDGVANINTNGLITNLAYININDQKIAVSLLDYLTELLNMSLALPSGIKEELRLELAAAVDLDDVTPEKLIEGVVEVLRDSQQWSEENQDYEFMKIITNLMIINLEDPNSVAYSIAIQRAEEIISNKFILYDNDDSKRIFSDFIDQIVKESLISFLNSQIGSLAEFISPDLLGQLLYAQDFDMPSGSIQKGALSYIVKIGTTVKSRGELIDLPVVSFDLGAELSTRIDQVQSILTLISVATNGKVTFTEAQLQSLIDAIYEIYGTPEAPDATGIGYGTASAVALWTSVTLPQDIVEQLPEDWNGTFIDYLMENSPAAWNNGFTVNWRVDALELFKECFELNLTQDDITEIDNLKAGFVVTNIPQELAQTYVGIAELALPDTIKENLPDGWQTELRDIYEQEIDPNWSMPGYAPTNDLVKQLLYIFADNMPAEWQDDLPEDWEAQIKDAGDAATAPTFTDIIRAAIDSLDADVQDAIEQVFRERSKSDISNYIRGAIALLDLFSPDAVVIPEAVNGTIPDNATYSVDFVALKATIAELDDSAIIPLKMGAIADITFLDDSTQQTTTLMKRINGTLTPSDAVNISIDKEPDKSTAETTKLIAAFLEAEQKRTPGFSYTILANDGEYIDFMLNSVIENLIYGGLLAVAILLLFLKELKATVVVGFSIVISVVATFVMMYFAGITLNVVSMGGLVLGVGMLVDNSIVIIENIYRMRAQGKNIFVASIQGAKQVTAAIVASTLTTVIVFVPIAFIEGLTKQIFTDMALTITFSLLASLIVALTLVPMATSTILKKPAKPDTKVLFFIKKSYARSLNFFLKHKAVPLILVAVLFAGSVFALFQMDTELFPEAESGAVSIDTEINKVAIDRYNAEKPIDEPYLTYDDVVAMAIENIIEETKKYDVIESVGIAQSSGMSIAGFSMGGLNLSANIKLVPEKQRSSGSIDLSKKLNAALNDMNKTKGLYVVKAGSSNFISDLNILGGDQTLKLYGKDLDTMKAEARRIKNLFIKKDASGNAMTDAKGDPIYIDGIENVAISGDDTVEEYRIKIDKSKANRYGLTVAQVFLQIQSALAEAGVSHTLNLVENSGDTSMFDVYIYTTDFKVSSWYVTKDKNGAEVPVYVLNNRAADDTQSVNEYFVTNTHNKGIYIKKGLSNIFIAEQGKIPLSKDGDTFSYILTKEGANKSVAYEQISFTLTGQEIYYNVDRVKEFDIVTFDIHTANMLDPSAPAGVVPLYKLLDDECFIKDDEGKIVYRTDILTDKVPVGLLTSDGYDSISHENKRRVESISLTFANGVNGNEMSDKVLKMLKEQYTAPTGVTLDTTIGNQYVDEVFDTLYLVLALAIVFIYLVMVAQFQSLKSPFIIMFTLPLAFTGCVAALFMANLGMSVMAMIGLIVLMGIVVNNGIVFVDYCNQLIQSNVPRRMALLRTGMDRLRPILMTAMTTIFALIITAADKSEGGAMLRPLAIATIGGLVYSTFLTLYIVPIIFDIFNKKAKQTERTRAFMDKDIDLITTTEVEDILSGSSENIINDILPGASLDEALVEINKDIETSLAPRRKNEKKSKFIDTQSLRYNKKPSRRKPPKE